MSLSHQNMFFFVLRFLMLSLSACNIGKKKYYNEIAKLNSKNRKNHLLPKKKSLVRLTPVLIFSQPLNETEFKIGQSQKKCNSLSLKEKVFQM